MMNFFSTTEIILLLMVFVIRTSMGISIHQYKRLEYMNDKISSEQNSLFTRKGSLIECIKECASIPNCVSVFHSKLFCKGYSVVYHPSSPNLISMQGIRYYACVYSNPGFCMTNSTDVFLPDSTTQIITDNSNQKTIITDATTQESSPETTSLSFSTADTSSPLYSTILTSTTSLQCKSFLSCLVITGLEISNCQRKQILKFYILSDGHNYKGVLYGIKNISCLILLSFCFWYYCILGYFRPVGFFASSTIENG